MMTYEYQTIQGTIVKIHWRLEEDNTKIRFTRNINNSLYHLTKDFDSTMTIEELTTLCNRVARLDTMFWTLID